ncbi:MAG: hypothetical protein IKN97_02960 [Lachnospiraceae bacterium]|jgi:hypothetical protein|nr:hypothetical protein [Lachnospiraceae bacterium]
MVLWLIVIVIVVVVAAVAGSAYRKNLLGSGQIVNRRAGFEEYAEILTIKEMPFAQVAEALKDGYYYGKANLTVNTAKQAAGFSGAGWTAQLYHMNDSDRNAYCFEFVNWQSRNGIPYEAIAMNTVLTAVEKVFLGLDPNTQVSSKKIEVTKKSHFF